MTNHTVKKIGIGISDFKIFIERGCYYVDKSLFIKDILEQGSQVSLILRPKHFGKTLNLSMLKYFFDCNEDNSALFEGLNIARYMNCMQHQGQYPVIYLTLSDMNCNTREGSYSSLYSSIRGLYAEYKYLLNSSNLKNEDKQYFKSILELDDDFKESSFSLKMLCHFLYKHFQHKVIILVDEYDVFTQRNSASDCNDVNCFLHDWLMNVLDDNSELEFAVLTGVFKTLNQVSSDYSDKMKVCSILEDRFSGYFGFTDTEIERIMYDFNYKSGYDNIVCSWYGGYSFGQLQICNPFSVMNFIDNNCNEYSNMTYNFGSDNDKFYQNVV